MQAPDRTSRPGRESRRRESTTTGHELPIPNPNSNANRDESTGDYRSTASGGSGRERIGNYVIGNEIGRGSFATVYKGYRSRSKQPIAIKAVSKSKLTAKLMENLEGEISILKAISHRHIVELEDCIKNDHHIYLIMAFCSGGDLSIYIKKRGRLPTLDFPRLLPDGSRPTQESGGELGFWPHPEEGGLDGVVTRCFLGQLTEAIKFLRVRNLIHRDIKPQNLLLHPPSEEEYAQGHPYGIPVLKVADFGFARILPAATMAETLCGSPLYMAPEILRYEKYDAKVDLWSIGAVLFEMAVGKPPFRAQNHVELLRRIEKGEDRIKFPDEKQPNELKQGETVGVPVDEDIKDLIRRLLKKNPENRMPFEDLFASRVWDGHLTTQVETSRTVEHESKAPASSTIPLARQDSRSRRRSTDLVPSQDRRRPSEPRYYVSSDATDPSRAQGPIPARSRQTSEGHAARPIEIAPPAPQPAHARPVAINASPAEQGVAMVRRPSTSAARRYSTLGRGNLFRQPERNNASDSASPVSQEAQGFNATDRPVSRASIGETSEAGRAASAQGNMQESEYVVVEKKTVEVNALADELDAAAKRPDGLVRRRSSRGGVLGRPVSALTSVASQGGLGSSPNSYSPPFALSTTPPFALPPGSHHRAPSLQSLSSSPNIPTRSRPMLVPSPTTNAVTTYGGGMTYHQTAHEAVFAESPPPGSSAWARAMGIAGMKLLGSPVNALGHLSRRPWRQARLSLTYKEEDPAEELLMGKLEDLAQKAHALYEFADAKLAQCMFPPKLSPSGGLSGGPGLGVSPNSHSYFTNNQHSAMSRRRSSSASTSSTDINIARMETMCAEATVLYLKSLAFLQNGVEQAKQHWDRRAAITDVVKTSAEFNETIQWFRHRFNDCFDKAEWTKSRSPEEMPESASYAEKLIYDKAIELSRAAAVTELVGEDLPSAENAYETALWLLYAVVDPLLHDGLEIGDADRHMVENVIASIRTRLDALKRKLGQAQQPLQAHP